MFLNKNLYICEITNSPNCSFCWSTDETPLHLCYRKQLNQIVIEPLMHDFSWSINTFFINATDCYIWENWLVYSW